MADLKWNAQPQAASYQLEQRDPADPQCFQTRYQGTDRASIRSGLAAGHHEFRVRAIDPSGSAGQWSETLTVKVTYMEASRLRLLLILGGIVVLATIAAILHGHFSHRRREEIR